MPTDKESNKEDRGVNLKQTSDKISKLSVIYMDENHYKSLEEEVVLDLPNNEDYVAIRKDEWLNLVKDCMSLAGSCLAQSSKSKKDN